MDPITFGNKRTAGTVASSYNINKYFNIAQNPLDNSYVVSYIKNSNNSLPPYDSTLEAKFVESPNLITQTDISTNVGTNSNAVYGVSAWAAAEQAYRYNFLQNNPGVETHYPFTGKMGIFDAGAVSGYFVANNDKSIILYVDGRAQTGQVEIKRSTDYGLTWTTYTSTINRFSARTVTVFFSNGKFVAKVHQGLQIYTSTDGLTWTNVADSSLFIDYSVAYTFFCFGNVAAFVGSNGSGFVEIKWSNDNFATHVATLTTNISSSITWPAIGLKITNAGPQNECVIGLSFPIKLTYNGTTVSYTKGPDLLKLSGSSTGITAYFQTIIYSGSKYYAGVSENGTPGGTAVKKAIYSSDDGLNWTELGSSVNTKGHSNSKLYPYVSDNSNYYGFFNITSGTPYRSGYQDMIAVNGFTLTRTDAGYSEKYYYFDHYNYSFQNSFLNISATGETLGIEYNRFTNSWNGFRAVSLGHADFGRYYFKQIYNSVDRTQTAGTASTANTITKTVSTDATTWNNVTYSTPTSYTNTININNGYVSHTKFSNESILFLTASPNMVYDLWLCRNDAMNSPKSTVKLYDFKIGATTNKYGVQSAISTGLEDDYSIGFYNLGMGDNQAVSGWPTNYWAMNTNISYQNMNRVLVTTDRFASTTVTSLAADPIDIYNSSSIYTGSVGTIRRFTTNIFGNDSSDSKPYFKGVLFGDKGTAGLTSIILPGMEIISDGTNVTLKQAAYIGTLGPNSTISLNGSANILAGITDMELTFAGTSGNNLVSNFYNSGLFVPYISSDVTSNANPTKIIFRLAKISAISAGSISAKNYVYDVAANTFTEMTGTYDYNGETFSNSTDSYFFFYPGDNVWVRRKVAYTMAQQTLAYWVSTDLTNWTLVDNPLNFYV